MATRFFGNQESGGRLFQCEATRFLSRSCADLRIALKGNRIRGCSTVPIMDWHRCEMWPRSDGDAEDVSRQVL